MPPYLTRKRTSSNSQETQSKHEALVTKPTSESSSIINEMLKVKHRAKIRDIRVTTRSRSISAKKQCNISVKSGENISPEEKQKTVRHKRGKRNINKEVPKQTEKILVHDTSKQELKNTKRNKIRKKVNKDASNNLKQISLKESFLIQTRTRGLRNRQIVEDNKNKDTLENECLSLEHQDNIVLINRLNEQKRKLPVYKCISCENSLENTNEVYDFKFDVNDSKERLPKKRRKRRVFKRKIIYRKKKNILEKQSLQKTEIDQEEPISDKCEDIKEKDPESIQLHKTEPMSINFKEITERNLSNSIENKGSVKFLTENQLEKNSMENLESKIDSNEEELSVQLASETLEDTNKEKITKTKTAKPTIISVENLNNNKIAIVDTQMSYSEDFKPFRPTNIFNNKLVTQHRSTFNYSLLEKSLSPIAKSSENFDLNSPWRPPLLTFSQVKNVFQSTPQNKKYEISGKTLMRPVNNEFKNYGNIVKVKNALQKNDENVNIDGHMNTSNFKKKNPTILRKFGREITNIEHSAQFTSTEDAENLLPNNHLNVNNSTMNNVSKFDNNENKENSVLNYESPKKTFKKEFKKVKFYSPHKITTNVRYNEQKENVDPQPGPSGLQNKVFNTSRVLKQSNLNNFLNVMEMPQSTTIITSHGIFDDAHSTPISRKVVTQCNKPTMELKNAFGFDDDSNENVSSSEYEVTNNEKENRNAVHMNVLNNSVKTSVRITAGQLKNNLLLNKPIESIKNEETVKKKKTKVISSMKTEPKSQIDATDFFDTFDVLSEMSDTPADNTSNNPLFVDLEPSHFTQPPRYSYKRKRNVKFGFSDESAEEEEEEDVTKYEIKRKKVNPMKIEQEKRLIQWVQNTNRTFDEIDQHELVIE